MVWMATTTTLLTFEEFEHLPDQPGKRELLRGELVEMPVAEFKHSKTSHQIFRRLDAALMSAHGRGEASELGEVYIEMGYKLAGDGYVQPDVSVTHAGQDVGKYLGGAPAIAIEVVSPSNTAQALDIKTELYFQFGAREVWRVYPKTRHIVVHIAGSSQAVTVRDSISTPLLPGFELNVQEVLGV
jgi:Uma2 family endonuclease